MLLGPCQSLLPCIEKLSLFSHMVLSPMPIWNKYTLYRWCLNSFWNELLKECFQQLPPPRLVHNFISSIFSFLSSHWFHLLLYVICLIFLRLSVFLTLPFLLLFFHVTIAVSHFPSYSTPFDSLDVKKYQLLTSSQWTLHASFLACPLEFKVLCIRIMSFCSFNHSIYLSRIQ